MSQPIHYTVTPLIERNVFAISMHIANHQNGFEVYLPTWIAGSYMLRDFARHIVHIRAVDARQQNVELTPTGQSSWHVASSRSVTLHYKVYAHDTSVRTAFLDDTGGFFNGTSLFLSVKALENQPHRVTLSPPAKHHQWQVATTLNCANKTAPRAFGDYIASSYDELVDHPVRMGRLTWLSFVARHTPHEVAIAGVVPQLNKALLVRDLKAICEAQIDLFHDVAPFKRYLFMVDARGGNDSYGGLEHRDSTALLCQRSALPNHSDALARRDAYIQFLGLCSHEYFHSWNVKRIKPDAFVNYDLTQAIDTSLLWFFEGVTSYYDDLMLLRCNIIDQPQYFKLIENTINTVVRQDGARVQTVNDSGLYAWTKYYQPSPNTPNAVVSYYAKGALIALAIDLTIRQHSAHSFDDVMRDLWLEFGQDFYQKPRGLVLDDIIRVCRKYAPQTTALIQSAVHSTDPLPLQTLFAAHGMNLTHQISAAQLGAAIKKADCGYHIMRVLNHSAAQKAGLAPDDIVFAFDQLKLNDVPDAVLSTYPMGAHITVHFWRDDVLSQSTLINQAAAHDVYKLALAAPQN